MTQGDTPATEVRNRQRNLVPLPLIYSAAEADSLTEQEQWTTQQGRSHRSWLLLLVCAINLGHFFSAGHTVTDKILGPASKAQLTALQRLERYCEHFVLENAAPLNTHD